MTTYNDTIDENLATSSPLGFTAPWVELLSENVEISDTFILDIYTHIFENLSTSSALSSRGILVSTVEEIAEVSDLIYILLEAFSSDVINVSLTDAEILLRISRIIESVTAADLVESKATLSTTLALAFTIADIANQAYSASIEELVDVLDSVVDLFVRSAIIIDQIETTMVQQDYVLIGIHVSEDLELDDSYSLSQILSSTLIDQIQFVGAIQSEEYYNTYSFNPEGYALTTYTNYNFNSIAEYNHKYLLANENGLFEYGGTTDNLTEIIAKVKTTAIDFGSSSKKQVKKMYLGITNDSSIVLKVTVDGKGTFYYELDSSTVGLDTQAIKIGKGLVGRYWQFELITKDNSSFELDEVEFLPVEFKRKI